MVNAAWKSGDISDKWGEMQSILEASVTLMKCELPSSSMLREHGLNINLRLLYTDSTAFQMLSHLVILCIPIRIEPTSIAYLMIHTGIN
jgi:hypothetical protein